MIILGLIILSAAILGLLSRSAEISPILAGNPEIAFLLLILTVFVIFSRPSAGQAEPVDFVKHISSQEFEMQKTLYTEYKVKQLIESPQYRNYERQRGNQ